MTDTNGVREEGKKKKEKKMVSVSVALLLGLNCVQPKWGSKSV